MKPKLTKSEVYQAIPILLTSGETTLSMEQQKRLIDAINDSAKRGSKL